MIKFTVPGMPRGKQRIRVTKTGHAYTPGETIVYENWVKQCALTAMDGREPLEGAVCMTIDIYLPIPRSWSKKKRQAAAKGDMRPIVKPDRSNVEKAIEDGCNGVVFVDDKQIVDGPTRKWYSGMPRVEVEVKEL